MVGALLAAIIPSTIDIGTSASAAVPSCPSTPSQAASEPDDASWAQQRLGAQRANALADGSGVTVAVIDSGVDTSQPQLKGAVVAGADLLDIGGDGRIDCVGHGTGVASVIAARPVQGSTFQGLAPGARILPIRVTERFEIDGGTTGRAAPAGAFAAAIRRAVDLGARVLNLSLVTNADDPELDAAVKYAIGKDAVVVVAAGNQAEQGDKTPYPASYPGVLAVGAIGADGRRTAASQTGPWLGLVATGDQVVTAALPSGRTVQNGTSFAAPFVSAAAALVLQYH